MTVNDLQGLGSVVQGDCLEVLKTFPDNSIDLICTDPPYYKVKAEWWDNQWDKPEGFLQWIDRLAEQWQRILKPNGSLYCFASPRMAAKVEVRLGDRFNVLNNIRWTKEAGWHQKADKDISRMFHAPSEAIIFCEHYGSDNAAKDIAGYETKCDEAARNTWGNYIKEVRIKHGLTAKDLTEVVGAYGTVNHGGACSNWEQGKNCPTSDHYAKLQHAFPGYFTRPYEELRQEYEELRQEYEELRRPFCISEDVPYTDVWNFPTVAAYPGKHPCEKPIALLQHIINASSREGAIVLDCFAGSGNTLVAAKSLARQHIGIEIDPHWVTIANQKLGNFDVKQPTLEERIAWLKAQTPSWKISQPKKDRNQLSLNLFAEEVF